MAGEAAARLKPLAELYKIRDIIQIAELKNAAKEYNHAQDFVNL